MSIQRYVFWTQESKSDPGYWAIVMAPQYERPRMVAMCKEYRDAAMIVAALTAASDQVLSASREQAQDDH